MLSVGQAPQASLPVVQQLGPVGPNMVVCMWDGATRSGSHSVGGMVILNPARDILLAKGIQFSVIDDPVVVELLVLREVILWCLDH
ncbi:unnamed protein product [Linum trigynum]|uniref:Uncharacterized protein n=1 Tax=Linum trigynum TaxID=586398 RepID=A0AAV2FNZ4_9ROSI